MDYTGRGLIDASKEIRSVLDLGLPEEEMCKRVGEVMDRVYREFNQSLIDYQRRVA